MKKNSLLLFVQYTGISTFSLLIAYPLLHELGHLLVALFFRGNIVAFSYFPLPSVTCSFIQLSQFQNVIISFSGLSLPVLVFALLPLKIKNYPILNFGSFLFEIIIECSLILSMVNCINSSDINDDIVKIASYSSLSTFTVWIVIATISIIVFLLGLHKKNHLALKQLSEQ